MTEELIPGARFSSCAYVNSSLRPQIIRDLELERHSLEMYTTDVMNFVMGEDGDHFFVWPEIDRTIKELERIGERDVDRFIEFGIRFRRFAKLVEPYLLAEPPSLSELIGAFENAGEIELWHEFVTGSVDSMLRRYFSHDLVSGLFTFFALVSVYAGPMDPGTAYGFSHHSWGEYDGEFGRFGFARGGMGAISDAIASAAREAGAVIRTNAEVEEIVTRGGGSGACARAANSSPPMSWSPARTPSTPTCICSALTRWTRRSGTRSSPSTSGAAWRVSTCW